MYKYATRNFGYLPTSSSAFSKECERMLHSACLLTSFITPPEFLTLFIDSPHTTLSPPFFIARKGMRGVSPYP